MPLHLRALPSLSAVLEVGWVKMNHPTTSTLRKPATGSFIAVTVCRETRRTIFFYKKKQKPKDGDEYGWQSTI